MTKKELEKQNNKEERGRQKKEKQKEIEIKKAKQVLKKHGITDER